ncbi:MAG: hypothetical protein EAY75_05820 [Bacteroidetes bacterium]|nr:MAG: hypothetical protein EAY75_05820 [Bacteroidota bacterium]
MTTIALGDTHGRTYWKHILEQEPKANKIVFIGDYFDTFEPISTDSQLANFLEILELKKQQPQRVVLLMGNHDFHYLPNAQETYSGYKHFLALLLQPYLQKAIDEQWLQICHVEPPFLFSHAGVSSTWCQNHHIGTNLNPLAFTLAINNLLHTNLKAFAFAMGPNHSPYGDDACQGPLWIRPKSLFKDAVPGYTQVVGHTQQAEMSISPKLTLIDTLGTAKTYLRIANGAMHEVPVPTI